MQARMLLLVAIMNCAVAVGAAEVSADIKQRLIELGTSDQAVRAKLGAAFASGTVALDQMKALAQEMWAVDAKNFEELKSIVARYGWPDVHEVGVEASNAAFLILQHSPLSAQKEMLPTFRAAVSQGKARTSDLAMLEDRILTGEGKKQRYGTQVTSGPNGVPRVDPIEDPEHLDERRKSLGLPPMDVYLERAEAELGRSIDKSALGKR